LEKIPANSKVLDVGIGTGAALVKNADIIRAKNLHVTGIDIDRDYLIKCNKLIQEAALQDRVECLHASGTEYSGGPFDAIYFSGSFMIIPPEIRVAMLRNMKTILVSKEKSRFYFTQTFQDKPNWFMEKLKPWLAWLTTIDFGKVTYTSDFIECLWKAGLKHDHVQVISKNHGGTAMLFVVHVVE